MERREDDTWQLNTHRPKKTSDLRDLRAVERISTELLKLFYPNLHVSIENFEKYCVDGGKEVRQLVRDQMALKDSQYKRRIADISLN